MDRALRVAAWAHEQAGHHRKGGDIPYIVHPYATMLLALVVTDDEDILIACLLHDVLEDVPAAIYDRAAMQRDFGLRVTTIVSEVSRDINLRDWHQANQAYLDQLEHHASPAALIVSLCDKIHNSQATLIDYQTHGDLLWQRFTVADPAAQVAWYRAVLMVARRRQAPEQLCAQLASNIDRLEQLLAAT